MEFGQELRLDTVEAGQTITLPAAHTIEPGQTRTFVIENKGPHPLRVEQHPSERITMPRLSAEDVQRYRAMLDNPTDCAMLGPFACELIRQAIEASDQSKVDALSHLVGFDVDKDWPR